MKKTAIIKNFSEDKIFRLRWWTLITISISMIVLVLDSTVMNVALPTIQKALNATNSELLWMVGSYTMVLGALMLATGSLGDRIGHDKLIQIGLVIFGTSSVGAALSSTPVALIIFRIVMGIGAAMIMPCTLSTIRNVFPENERGQAIGIWAGISAIGIALGPIIGGMLVKHFEWSSIFILNIPVTVIALIMGWFFIPNTRDEKARKIDIIGNLLSLTTLSLLIFGLFNSSSKGWDDPQVFGTVIASVLLIGVFILWERKVSQPLLNLGFFRESIFSAGIFILILIGLAQSGIIYNLTYYLQLVQGYDPLGAGVRFIPYAGGMLFGAVIADRLVKRTSEKLVMAIGFIGTAITLVLLAFLKVDSSFWQAGTELLFSGIFLGCIVAPITNIIMESLPKEEAGIGSAINSTFRMIASTLGVAILGPILTSIYASRFMDTAVSISGLPAELAEKASDSVGMALGIAGSGQLPSSLANIIAQLARDSFMDGWFVAMLIAGVLFIIGAIVTLKYIPSRH